MWFALHVLFFPLSYGQSFVLQLWGVFNPCWLTLVLLLWACLIWIIPRINPRDSLYYTSPVLVIYAIGLLCLQYVYSLDGPDFPSNGSFVVIKSTVAGRSFYLAMEVGQKDRSDCRFPAHTPPSFTCSLTHPTSFTHTPSLIHMFPHTLTCSLTHPPSFTCSLIHHPIFTCSLPHHPLFTHPPSFACSMHRPSFIPHSHFLSCAHVPLCKPPCSSKPLHIWKTPDRQQIDYS